MCSRELVSRLCREEGFLEGELDRRMLHRRCETEVVPPISDRLETLATGASKV